MKPYVLITGWGRSGKDEAGAFLHCHCNVPYCSSTSWAALPLMATYLKLPQQLAWETRHENRQLWKDVCDQFRAGDPLVLIRRALRLPGRVVTGIRDKSEIQAAVECKIFDRILWVDRPGTPVDPTVTFGPEYATDIVKNDGTLRQFHLNLYRLALDKLGGEPNVTEYAKSLHKDL